MDKQQKEYTMLPSFSHKKNIIFISVLLIFTVQWLQYLKEKKN